MSPGPVPNSAWCTALLAERLLICLSLARLGARGQHRCLSGVSLPVFSLLPRRTCSSLKHGEPAGEMCGGRMPGPPADPQRRPVRCGRTAAVLRPLRSAPPRPARPGPGGTLPGGSPLSKGSLRDRTSRNPGRPLRLPQSQTAFVAADQQDPLCHGDAEAHGAQLTSREGWD